MAVQLQNFVCKHPPAQELKKASAAQLSAYERHLPGCLLELWAEHGFGLYGNGLIQLIDPDTYRGTLWGWLMREEEDMSRLPIAMNAFGELYYYRKLSEHGDEDVSFLDPHTSESSDLVWSLEEFFNEWCCDQEVIADFLMVDMVREAAASKGELERNQMYCFVPALRLGGTRSAANVERGDAVVHLEFLLQLALGETA